MQALVQVNKAEKLAKKKGGHGVRPCNLYATERSRLFTFDGAVKFSIDVLLP